MLILKELYRAKVLHKSFRCNTYKKPGWLIFHGPSCQSPFHPRRLA